MKTLLKLEELAEIGLGVYCFSQLSFAWWYFPALFLSPDISMIGYVFNPKMGAWLYNFCHHKGVAILLLVGGWVWQNEIITLIGSIALAHAAFDRLLGYGLKYETAFHNTHLGVIGKQK